LFGLVVKWRRHSQDRLSRLARAIEGVAEHDQLLIDESAQVDTLRGDGAACLYRTCREFVDQLNAKLSKPVVVLDPPSWNADTFDECGANLLQISLRGRLLQLEFAATDEPYSTEEFRHRYVLRGSVRSFNQNFLEMDKVDEQMIFYCPRDSGAAWHFFDPRTYRTGLLSVDYLASELERLL
jgi:hypothetical protein